MAWLQPTTFNKLKIVLGAALATKVMNVLL
jgi:hypothetical protein